MANILAGCLEQLQELTTPDDLMEFVHGDLAMRVSSFNQVESPVQATANSSSIMGIFLRQCIVSFDSLSFEVCPSCIPHSITPPPPPPPPPTGPSGAL